MFRPYFCCRTSPLFWLRHYPIDQRLQNVFQASAGKKPNRKVSSLNRRNWKVLGLPWFTTLFGLQRTIFSQQCRLVFAFLMGCIVWEHLGNVQDWEEWDYLLVNQHNYGKSMKITIFFNVSLPEGRHAPQVLCSVLGSAGDPQRRLLAWGTWGGFQLGDFWALVAPSFSRKAHFGEHPDTWFRDV